MKIIKRIRVLPQYFMPRTIISYCADQLANSQSPRVKNFLIKRFIKKHKINLNRFQIEEIEAYHSFNDFFIRKLKKNQMGKTDENEIASPAEALIREFGQLQKNKLLQAKNLSYTLEHLLANENDYTHYFKKGSYITFHLEPNNYHRYHMPITGTLESSLYVPHRRSFELDPNTEDVIPNLFCNNERYILFFNTEVGKLCIVLIGALWVGGIQPVWMNEPINYKKITREDHRTISLNKSEELGYFKYGSSIILIFEPNRVQWKDNLTKNKKIKVNAPIADIKISQS